MKKIDKWLFGAGLPNWGVEKELAEKTITENLSKEYVLDGNSVRITLENGVPEIIIGYHHMVGGRAVRNALTILHYYTPNYGLDNAMRLIRFIDDMFGMNTVRVNSIDLVVNGSRIPLWFLYELEYLAAMIQETKHGHWIFVGKKNPIAKSKFLGRTNDVFNAEIYKDIVTGETLYIYKGLPLDPYTVDSFKDYKIMKQENGYYMIGPNVSAVVGIGIKPEQVLELVKDDWTLTYVMPLIHVYRKKIGRFTVDLEVEYERTTCKVFSVNNALIHKEDGGCSVNTLDDIKRIVFSD